MRFALCRTRYGPFSEDECSAICGNNMAVPLAAARFEPAAWPGVDDADVISLADLWDRVHPVHQQQV